MTGASVYLIPFEMTELFLAGLEAQVLAHPTAKESLIIEEFSSDPSALGAIREQIAKHLVRAINEPNTTIAAVSNIFDAINESLEKRLIEVDPGFEAWTFGSMQPRILARASGVIPSLDHFICQAFGSSMAGKAPIGITGMEQSFLEFVLSAFWEEVARVRKSEIAANLDEAIQAWWFRATELIGVKEKESKYRKRVWDGYKPTHTFFWSLPRKEATQYIVFIKEGQITEFLDLFISAQDPEPYLISRFGRVLERISAKQFLELRRGLHCIDYKKRFDRVKEKWSRSVIMSDLNAHSANYAPSSAVEKYILSAIIASQLDNKTTVKSRDDAPLSLFGKEPKALTLTNRLEIIDEYVARNPGKPVSSIILDTFPELRYLEKKGGLDLPNTAPAKWPEERVAVNGVLENPPEFIKRVYAPWLGLGLTRADIRTLDRPLSTALDNWLRRNEMPADLDLPTVKEQNTRWLDKIKTEGSADIRGGHVDAETMREARRLAALERKRRNIGQSPE